MLCFPSIKEFISPRALELKVYTLPQPREFYEDRRGGFGLKLGGSDVFLLFINDLALSEAYPSLEPVKRLALIYHRLTMVYSSGDAFLTSRA